MQFELPLYPPPDDPLWAGLTCAHGTPRYDVMVGDGCPGCEAATAQAIAEFDAAVARGEYDAEGYTPAERRAQARRRATR